jgi:spore maturation protein SpmB
VLDSWGLLRKAPVYETLAAGGKEGFQAALCIIPYPVAILVAVGMLGAMDVIVGFSVSLPQPMELPD